MTNTEIKKRPRRMARERSSEIPASTESRKASALAPRGSSVVIPSREPTKTEKILNLLRRQEGATLEELTAATGWLPHTARAALTGLKKKGHTIERTKTDGVSRYSVKEAQS